jgi:hypothetical protein
MKTASGTMATVLSGNAQEGASLYTFFLDTPLYLTDAGFDVVFDAGDGAGSKTYESARTAVKRGRSRLALSIAPDDVEITLSLGSLANGTTIRFAAVRGQFSGRRVRVQKLFSSSFPGDVSAGAVSDVDGPGYVADVSSAELRLTVKSRTDLLSRQLPPRVVAPGCQWQLYGPGCLAVLATFSEARTLAGGSTASSLVTTVAPTKANAGGLVWFTSGVNAGVQRNIQAAGGSTITPTVAFPFAPTAGDAISVALGCDRSRGTCQSLFANLTHFGGFPDVPDTVPKVLA